MKTLITVLLFNCFGLAAFSQGAPQPIGLEAYALPSNPQPNKALLVIVAAEFSFGAGSTCPPLLGFKLRAEKPNLIIDLFYNTSGIWPQQGCTAFDSISVSTFPQGIEKIIVNGYSIIDRGTVSLADTTAGASDTLFLGTTGIDALAKEKGQIKIYPNPAKGSLYIEKLEQIKIEELYLTDISGKVVRRFNKKAVNLDVSALARGTYLLQYKSKEGAFVKKVVLE